jgi:hypothetical protein
MARGAWAGRGSTELRPDADGAAEWRRATPSEV